MPLRSVSEIFVLETPSAIPLNAVPAAELEDFWSRQDDRTQKWLGAQDFKAEAGRMVLIPAPDGGVSSAILGLGDMSDPWVTAQFAAQLPPGAYRFAHHPQDLTPDRLALAWALGAYSFDRYRTAKPAKTPPKLVWPQGARKERVIAMADAVCNARDWINTPASDMGPGDLEAACHAVAERHGAKVTSIKGEALLKANFPLVHAVGRAASGEPRLMSFEWGAARGPRIALVGKGVCFDSGGLNLKPGASMATMKKDMGGAACVLGLAHMIMTLKLPVHLTVWIPAVENSISGCAYRPGDVLTSRNGLTVEIGNTDAEGRLILADAIARAGEDAPDLTICIATLTGAARVATGFELPPFFTDDEPLAQAVMAASLCEADPAWRLPLWKPYAKQIEGKLADLTNAPDAANAGAIHAALFLSRFAGQSRSFLHIDIAGWTEHAKPGRPIGAEANGMRAMFGAVERLYG
jgi:leucyl aminopeptidase